jgi:hypothetical protein
LGRIALAFRSFFGIIFGGKLPEDVTASLGLVSKAAPARTPVKAPPAATASDGALQILAILQRDSRLVDFLMEDIASFGDDQVGAVARNLHGQARDALVRHVRLEPVIDGVEGVFTTAAGLDAAAVKWVGNVPAQTPTGGTLRHKGWRAAKVDLPAAGAKHDSSILAPAEIEVE